jgi:hypothetical protein
LIGELALTFAAGDNFKKKPSLEEIYYGVARNEV